MKCHSALSFFTFITCLLFTSDSFSQSSFTDWVKDTTIEGQTVQILRVPENEIVMSRAKYDVVGAQRQLDKCLQEYKEGKQAYLSTIQFNLDFLKVNVPDWPISYYEKEIKAYQAYNVVQEKRDWEFKVAKAKRQADSTRLAKQVAGYSFINKPSVLIKQKPSAGSMTMGTIYRGSYVEYMGAVDSTNYILIHSGTEIQNSLTGYIHADDIVNELNKLDVPDEEMTRLKSYYYCKVEESAQYKAMIDKLVKAEMAADAKMQSSAPKSRRTYYTGPRGGCYYINSNGNKQYVDHSLCR